MSDAPSNCAEHLAQSNLQTCAAPRSSSKATPLPSGMSLRRGSRGVGRFLHDLAQVCPRECARASALLQAWFSIVRVGRVESCSAQVLVLCASTLRKYSAQMLCANALRRLLCASCSAQVLCASCSAQVRNVCLNGRTSRSTGHDRICTRSARESEHIPG